MNKITPAEYEFFAEIYQRVKKRAEELCDKRAMEEKKIWRKNVEFISFEAEEGGYMRISCSEAPARGGGDYIYHDFYFDIDDVCDLD